MVIRKFRPVVVHQIIRRRKAVYDFLPVSNVAADSLSDFMPPPIQCFDSLRPRLFTRLALEYQIEQKLQFFHFPPPVSGVFLFSSLDTTGAGRRDSIRECGLMLSSKAMQACDRYLAAPHVVEKVKVFEPKVWDAEFKMFLHRIVFQVRMNGRVFFESASRIEAEKWLERMRGVAGHILAGEIYQTAEGI